MHVNWRVIMAARNTCAVMSAACEVNGWNLTLVDTPTDDVTCYSLNSITVQQYRDEISNADCTTIVGGPHATACWKDVVEYADYVVIDEGEYTLPRLLTDIENGGDGHIPGVATGSWYKPADTNVRLDAYPAFSELQGYVEITRGCPFSCGYCQTPQIFGHCMRHRSIDEIVKYARKYGQARFVSPNAFAYGSDGTHPRWEKIERLLRTIRQDVFFGTFPSEVRPEFVTQKSLDLIKEYCTNTKLHFGAQSGSNSILSRLKRGHTVEDAIRAAHLCSDSGITPVIDFIVGFPFETDEEQLETVAVIRDISRIGKIHVHQFIPLPGTALAETSARSLLPETKKVCGKLALGGKLTGSWNDPAIRFFKPHSQ